jgi:hypothetical protein
MDLIALANMFEEERRTRSVAAKVPGFGFSFFFLQPEIDRNSTTVISYHLQFITYYQFNWENMENLISDLNFL